MRRRIIILVILVALLFFLFSIVTSLYPELLWFSSFGYGSIWLLILQRKVAVFCLAFIGAFLFITLNVWVARRISASTMSDGIPRFRTPFAKVNEFLSRLAAQQAARSATSGLRQISRWFFLAIAAGASLLLALAAKARWQDIYAYFYQVPYGLTEPHFSRDISFYFFSLPFFNGVQNWLAFLFVVTLGVVAWIYFSHNILLFLFSSDARNKRIRPHIFILAALFLFCLAAGTYLKTYSILFLRSGVVFGAGYTDIHVVLPYLKLLSFLFLLAGVVLVIWAFRSGWKIPLYLAALIVLVMFLGGSVLPGIVQNYVVAPNEFQREKSFIENNIFYTRQAYGLDKIVVEPFPATYNLTLDDIRNNQNVINNIRLWNEEPLKQTFSQLQEIRLYYEFENVDVDRYMVNGNMEQVMLSPREMAVSQLAERAQTWVNRHLVYTHGYGLVMSPVSEITPDGLPYFYIKDIPPASSLSTTVSRPEIYFGESETPYILANTNQPEFDYPRGDNNVYSRYEGSGGIALDTFFKRLIYAMKFSNIKFLISPLIKKDSRLLYDHTISTIVAKLTPFILYDPDPYIVLTDEGRLVWMYDGYTASNRFPYSDMSQLGVNYMRNSVKVTIDAYSGETRFYIMEGAKDPIIQSFNRMFPHLFRPFAEMPADLKEHIRYPCTLFLLQSIIYSTYHMTDPQVFYNREDLWNIPKETFENKEQFIKPYYMVTRLPKDVTDSFILMLPFTPSNKNNMIAWLSAKCDPASYGELKVYRFPKERTIYGPVQIESRIDQDTEISQHLTLWGQAGSRVIRGNLMVVPIKDSLIYVEPIYLQATQSRLPELKRVIFAYHDEVVMAETLDAAIQQVFEGKQPQSPALPTVSLPGTQTLPSGYDEAMDRLIRQFALYKQQTQQLQWVEAARTLDSIDQLITLLIQYRSQQTREPQ